jgi:hypothetical protein
MHSAPLVQRNDSADRLGCSKVGTTRLCTETARTTLGSPPRLVSLEDDAENRRGELSIITVVSGRDARGWRVGDLGGNRIMDLSYAISMVCDRHVGRPKPRRSSRNQENRYFVMKIFVLQRGELLHSIQYSPSYPRTFLCESSLHSYTWR